MTRALRSGRHLHPGVSNFDHATTLLRAFAHCGRGPANHSAPGRRRLSLATGLSAPLRKRAALENERLPLTAPAFQPPDDEDLTFSEALKMGALEMLYQRRKRTKPQPTRVNYPALGDSVYGKWQHLALDEEAMRRQVELKASSAVNLRLVDQPGNESDMQLWACLMEFCYRRMGYEGVVMLWQSVLRKKTLHQVDGPLPQAFWGRILSAAIKNDVFLLEVVEYAKWLYQEHNVQWPKLYSTVMRHMLPHGAMDQVLQWHVTLASLYPVDEAEFTQVMKENVIITNEGIQESLRLLYKTGPHRTMYDHIIPYLYSSGHEMLARQWRKVFLLVNDRPKSLAARPFLRYLLAYYSDKTRFTDEEMAVAGRSTVASANEPDDLSLSNAADTVHNLRYLVNKVHGETFGIDEKPYNDQLGAKWLASTWVSLDFAISLLHTLGVREIGPLSIRAIAWRERLAQPLSNRIKQLAQWGIHVTESNYAQALRHYADVRDDEALQELVSSDIHPDIFDSEEAQHEVLTNCLRVGEWTTYQLILKTMMAVSSNHLSINSNKILESILRQGNGTMALNIMQELRSQGIGLTPDASYLVSSFIVQNLVPHRGPPEERQHVVDLCRSLCRELASTRFPPAVQAWRTVLLRLGREGRLDDLDRLSLEIIRMFASYRESNSPMWACPSVDVPAHIRDPSPYETFQELPRDLGLRRPNHPLRLIFDNKMQNLIVRWGFQYTRYDFHGEARATAVLKDNTAQRLTHNTNPNQYYFARGIRLMAMLRDRGLFYFEDTIRKQIKLRLIDLYRGQGKVDYEWVGGNKLTRHRRWRNRLTLAEAKQLCDKAWGREGPAGGMTPSMLELERIISDVGMNDQVKSIHRAGQQLWSQSQTL